MGSDFRPSIVAGCDYSDRNGKPCRLYAKRADHFRTWPYHTEYNERARAAGIDTALACGPCAGWLPGVPGRLPEGGRDNGRHFHGNHFVIPAEAYPVPDPVGRIEALDFPLAELPLAFVDGVLEYLEDG
jgi:hypothetical protein